MPDRFAAMQADYRSFAQENGVLDMPPGYTADEQINRYAWEHQGRKRAIQAGAVLGGIVVALNALVWAWRRRRGARTGRAGQPFWNSGAVCGRASPAPTPPHHRHPTTP